VKAGPEVERARQVLVTLIDLSMMSRREVERRMVERGVGVDLGRVLRGRLQLRLCHVAAICQALDLHPLEFCRMVFGEPKQRSPLLRRLDGVFALLKL
jgi:hypothetical protein